MCQHQVWCSFDEMVHVPKNSGSQLQPMCPSCTLKNWVPKITLGAHWVQYRAHYHAQTKSCK